MVARPVVLPWETPKGRRANRAEREETAPIPDGRHRNPLPEYTVWRDDGCNEAPHCLSCPLPECVHDRLMRRGINKGPHANIRGR